MSQIVQGGTRKILHGEKPFKPLTEQDPLIETFRDKVGNVARKVGIDFQALSGAVIEDWLEKEF